MSEVKLPIASLGTREEVIKVKATLSVTAGADTTTTLAVVFEKPFAKIPEVLGVVCVNEDAVKASFSASAVTKVGMDVNAYQVLEADLADGDYIVEVSIAGWVAA